LSDIGSELRVRLLGASKELLEGREIEDLSAQQLFILATWVPGRTIKNALDWEEDRIEMMEWSLARQPDLGTIHSVMADKMAHLANIYPRFDTPATAPAIQMHAASAIELAPLNPEAMFNVAQSHWHAGRIAESHAMMNRVLDLDPGNNLARFYSEVMPYTCALAPDSVINGAINFDASLSTNNPIRWITLSWIAALHANKGDYETALDYEQRAALIFEVPYTFMRRAMLMNKLGRPDTAANLIIRQRENWPDISPQHFADVTVPRLCGDASLSVFHEKDYRDFATAMEDRL
jgi:tetratricopeptide (TPR) repeat protein